MPAYHQIGHDSENLIFEPELAAFGGCIVSPVNYGPDKTRAQVERARKDSKTNLDIILDPQLYVPRSNRGQLRTWNYFPADVDTVDLTSMKWWFKINESLSKQATGLSLDAVCSPVMLPKADHFTDAYYSQALEISADLCNKLANTKIRPIHTAVVSLKELALPSRPMEVASLLSSTEAQEIYLILQTDVPARRELEASDQLEGAVNLIKELKAAGLKILVGFCAADMIIWKAAGAHSCATGKFFNLRRFTPRRFEDPSDGGKNIAYFFEEALLAFLREADIKRLRTRNLLSKHTEANPFAQAIFDKFQTQPGKAWVGDGWRQFLYWFADCEARVSDTQTAEAILHPAEQLWTTLNTPPTKLLFEEPANDGAWVRPWRIASGV
jgi:hypothetical protein